MIYEYENGILTAYNVKVDVEKLQQIRKNIVENCSVIRHSRTFFENDGVDRKIEIQKQKEQSGKILVYNFEKEKYDDNYDLYTYDEYIVPNIIRIIDMILKGHHNFLKGLFNTADVIANKKRTAEYVTEYKYAQIFEAISKLEKYTKNNKDSSLLCDAKELIETYEDCSLTLPKLSIKDYYAQLQNCFELTKVQEKSVDINELNKLKEQYGDNWYNEIIDKLNALKELESNIAASVDHQFIKRFGKSGKSKKKN